MRRLRRRFVSTTVASRCTELYVDVLPSDVILKAPDALRDTRGLADCRPACCVLLCPNFVFPPTLCLCCVLGFGGLPAAHRVTLFGWYPRDAACASRLGNASSRYAGYEARKPAGLFPLPLPSPSSFYDTTRLL